MSDAMTLFGLAACVSSIALVIWVVGRLWLRAKALEVTGPASLQQSDAGVAAALMRVEARLAELERTADATAIEVERIAEAHRFLSRQLAEGSHTRH